VFAQSNDVDSILEKAQESLSTQKSESSKTTPTMIVDNECDTTNSGANIIFNTAGFEPNLDLKWRLQERPAGYTPASGTFRTNGTGGFYESVFIKDLSDGEYSLIFGEPTYNSIPNQTKFVLSCTKQQTSFPTDSIPSDISINATVKEGDYLESNLYLQNATISFGRETSLCPDNQCSMDFEDTTFNEFGQNRYFTGTIKVEDKANSDENFTAYNYYKIAGTFGLASSRENPTTGEKILFYTGTFGISKPDSYISELEFDSQVKLAGNNLMLKGKEK
jgi:hypothetical protein